MTPTLKTRDTQELITLVFFREEAFYVLDFEKPEGKTLEQIAGDNAACNPGTVRVEDMRGNVLWPAGQMNYLTRDTQDQIVGWVRNGVIVADRKRVAYVMIDERGCEFRRHAKLTDWLKENSR